MKKMKKSSQLFNVTQNATSDLILMVFSWTLRKTSANQINIVIFFFMLHIQTLMFNKVYK